MHSRIRARQRNVTVAADVSCSWPKALQRISDPIGSVLPRYSYTVYPWKEDGEEKKAGLCV